MILMRCLGLANGRRGPAGQFLESYDQYTGFSHWTTNKSKAMSFSTVETGWEMWRSVLTSDPVRPWDGKPNRPLTAFSVEIGEFE